MSRRLEIGAVRVNGVEIPPAAIAAEIQNYPAPSPDMARDAAVRGLVIRELLLQEARRLGLEAHPMTDEAGRLETNEDALIRALLDTAISIPEADEAACRRYYESNAKRFRSPDLFEAAHILISASADNSQAYEAAVRDAESIIAQLSQRPELFADIARERSGCPSAKDGGHLGQITRGQTTPEFETFLLELAEGQICPVPVKAPYGVHVLRLDRKIEGNVLPFEAVKPVVARHLREASFRQAVTQYIRLLAGRAEIEGSVPPLAQ